MSFIKSIIEFILGWTKDVAELRTTFKGYQQHSQ